jgi:peptidoglycan/xylan/chitin deacetylase (PgdA/CDA1 family)/folate-dependent phosphoribosylglycinamide formyltransferase PurN
MSPRLRLVFLIGADSTSTRASIEAICALSCVDPAAILLDVAKPKLSTRVKNLRRNIRKEGYGYTLRRLVEAVSSVTDQAVERIFPEARILDVLRRAFPDRCFTLADISRRYGAPVVPVNNLNSVQAAEILAGLEADLGVVIGTRVLKRGTFGLPKLGSINLHKGAVPEYRGLPPGFWEMYHGEKYAGVTVHFLDDSLDTGDIVERSQVEILPLDTPDSLLVKLHAEGAKTVARAVSAIHSGAARATAQERKGVKPHSRPTSQQVLELRGRLPHWQTPDLARGIAKDLFALGVYYSGVYALARWLHRHRKMRAAVILYHRVNDLARDSITVSLERFAAHMLMLSEWYAPASSSEIVEGILRSRRLRPGSVAVHFDDCYRDVFLNAMPIANACGVPATAFVSSGFVGTGRVFDHDLRKSPFRFENFQPEDLRGMLAGGMEIGAHTVNHVDLGGCSLAEAEREISGSVRELKQMTGRPVPLFSFPFGRRDNIRDELRQAVAAAGCMCMFSAFGGMVEATTEAYAIPRFGASAMHKPLYLALEIEGLWPHG